MEKTEDYEGGEGGEGNMVESIHWDMLLFEH